MRETSSSDIPSLLSLSAFLNPEFAFKLSAVKAPFYELSILSMAVIILLVVLPPSVFLLRHHFQVTTSPINIESPLYQSSDLAPSQVDPLDIPGSFNKSSGQSSAIAITFQHDFDCPKYRTVQFVLRWRLEEIFASQSSNTAGSVLVSLGAQAVSLLGLFVSVTVLVLDTVLPGPLNAGKRASDSCEGRRLRQRPRVKPTLSSDTVVSSGASTHGTSLVTLVSDSEPGNASDASASYTQTRPLAVGSPKFSSAPLSPNKIAYAGEFFSASLGVLPEVKSLELEEDGLDAISPLPSLSYHPSASDVKGRGKAATDDELRIVTKDNEQNRFRRSVQGIRGALQRRKAARLASNTGSEVLTHSGPSSPWISEDDVDKADSKAADETHPSLSRASTFERETTEAASGAVPTRHVQFPFLPTPSPTESTGSVPVPNLLPTLTARNSIEIPIQAPPSIPGSAITPITSPEALEPFAQSPQLPSSSKSLGTRASSTSLFHKPHILSRTRSAGQKAPSLPHHPTRIASESAAQSIPSTSSSGHVHSGVAEVARKLCSHHHEPSTSPKTVKQKKSKIKPPPLRTAYTYTFAPGTFESLGGYSADARHSFDVETRRQHQDRRWSLSETVSGTTGLGDDEQHDGDDEDHHEEDRRSRSGSEQTGERGRLRAASSGQPGQTGLSASTSSKPTFVNRLRRGSRSRSQSPMRIHTAVPILVPLAPRAANAFPSPVIPSPVIRSAGIAEPVGEFGELSTPTDSINQKGLLKKSKRKSMPHPLVLKTSLPLTPLAHPSGSRERPGGAESEMECERDKKESEKEKKSRKRFSLL